MASQESSLGSKIGDFRRSVAADLFSPSDIVDFEAAQNGLDKLSNVVARIEVLAAGGVDSQELAQSILVEPDLYRVLCGFLSIVSEVALEDGRRLPNPLIAPKDAELALEVAEILVELGIRRLLTPGVDASKLLLIAQISDDSARRRFRVDAKVRRRALAAVLQAIDVAKLAGTDVELGVAGAIPNELKRMADYIILVGGIPRAIVAVTFQSHGGGRQSRELTSTFPQLARLAEKSSLSLILIADGRGMREMSDRTLSALFTAVPSTFSFAQAESGDLAKAFSGLAEEVAPRPMDDAAIEGLVESGLRSGPAVMAADLPLSDEAARLALARFASRRSELALRIDSSGAEISWARRDLVERFRALRTVFDVGEVVRAAGELFAGLEGQPILDSELGVCVFRTNDSYVQSIGIGAVNGAVSADSLRELSKEVLRAGLPSRLAVLVVAEEPGPRGEQLVGDAQASLPLSTIVISLPKCIQIAQFASPPASALQELALSQSDLTKLSPFVVRGVTPERVFFGREEEQATMLSTLGTNSVALLGGRRIGKTSLMRHSFARLTAANLAPFFGDCQVVRTWSEFGALAARNWGVSTVDPFLPSHLFDVVSQLRQRGNDRVVILLDEIDQLLDWDRKRHGEDNLSEAFFRVCRSISQQGLAQFVFSGERTIADRIWDPASPHWNFCRPLMLRQLTEAATRELILEPLKGMGIAMVSADEIAAATWDRTSGHPELVQVIGDGMVSQVNSRPRTEIYCDVDDVFNVTDNYEFAEQYLETYWGQATTLEKLLSLLLQHEGRSLDFFATWLHAAGINVELGKIQSGLRMLELYGVADQDSVGYSLRLNWFEAAASYYGGIDAAIHRFAAELMK